MVAVTPLPDAPALVEGVIDVRGALVPVLALRARLGVPSRVVSSDEHLVLLRRSQQRDTVACRVDQARELTEIDGSAMTTPTGMAAAGRGVAGVATTTDGLLVVHDIDAFLNEAESLALDHALRASAT